MKKLKRKNAILALTFVITIAIAITAMSLSALAVDVSIGNNEAANFTNAQFYVWGSSNVTTYTTSSGTTASGAIYPDDLCTVLDATGTYWKVSYPTSSGTKTAYCHKANILFNTSYSKRISIAANSTVYRKSDMSISFGTAFTSDTIYLLSPISNGKAQIIYNVSGGYKIGWIYATEDTPIEPATSWSYPMDNPTISWNSAMNMTWATNRYGVSTGRDYHLGIDIKSPYNNNVYAAAKGKVMETGHNNTTGNYVIIKHLVNGKFVYSFYQHLAEEPTVSGNVTKGQLIGQKGNTGSSSTGAHLHFGIADTFLTNASYSGYAYASNFSSTYKVSADGDRYFEDTEVEYNNVTYYSPKYVVENNKLP